MTITVDTSDPVVVQVLVPGIPGPRGWVPVLAVVQDGDRTVQQVVDYTGGALPKPEVGLYVGLEGLVESISDATDTRGATGPTYNPRGEWDYQATYLPLDTVSFQGSSYVAKAFGGIPNVNVVPSSNPDWWDLQLDGSGAANDRAAAETAAGLSQSAAASAASAASTTATNATVALGAQTGAVAAQTGAVAAQTASEAARDQAQGAVASGRVRKASLSLLNAVAASYPDGAVGVVDRDGINNGEYVRDSGIWLKTSNATVPALAVLADANQLTVGEIVTTVNTANFATASGATTILVNGIVQGMSVPALSAGTNSYFTARAPITADQIARFAGCTVYMVAVFDATANLLAERPQLASATAQVRRGSTTIGTGSVERLYQTGTKIVKVVSFTLDPTDTSAGVTFQFAAPVTAANAHAVQLASLSWYPVVPGTIKSTSVGDALLDYLVAKSVATATQSLQASIAANTTGIADVFGRVTTFAVQALNGATPRVNSAGDVAGFTIPAGSSGASSLIQPIIPIPADLQSQYASRTVRIYADFATSDNWALTFTPLWAGHSLTNIVSSQISTNRRTVKFEVALSGTETAWNWYYQKGGSSALAADAYIGLEGIRVEVIATPSAINTVSSENLSLSVQWSAIDTTAAAVSQAVDAATAGNSYAHTVYVGPAATYPTIPAALAAITDASETNRYEIRVYSGTYTDVEGRPKHYVDIRGIGPVKPWLRGYLPPETDPNTIAATSTLWLDKHTKITNLRITCQNMRYAIHAETNNLPDTYDITMWVEDCDIEHLGNDEARAYQAAHGGLTVWASELPVGHGTSSGAHLHYERCRLTGPVGGLHAHTRANFQRPSMITAHGCVLASSRDEGGLIGGYGASISSLGSGQRDIVVLDSCSIVGALSVQPTPWYQSTLAYQPAVRNEYGITLINCSPTPYLVRDGGTRALKIESASTLDTSAVTVSGTAVPIIFGDVVTYPSGGGLKGAVWGSFDIADALTGPSSNLQITSIGKRLGDCTSNPVSLVITVDGGAPVTVTFNSNYTASSNTSIVNTINSTLGATATASLYNTELLYRPTYATEEVVLVNTSTEAIRQKHVVAYNTTEKNCRKMTSFDPVTQLAGIAMEDIRPGQRGRVHARGAVRVSVDLIRSDSGAFALGDTFGVGATPGEAIKGASVPLFRAYNTMDVRWG
ncbi:hypothetical protein [Roseixanthobacter pseudopolyaromaticivorans]|uniref:hypothetical protein n=1 Tax=Xanthobacteraceae TaxID=335928 RepID=UPI00372AF1D8